MQARRFQQLTPEGDLGRDRQSAKPVNRHVDAQRELSQNALVTRASIGMESPFIIFRTKEPFRMVQPCRYPSIGKTASPNSIRTAERRRSGSSAIFPTRRRQNDVRSSVRGTVLGRPRSRQLRAIVPSKGNDFVAFGRPRFDDVVLAFPN